MTSRRIHFLILSLVFLVSAGLYGCGTSEASYQEPGQAWPDSTPEAEGINPAAIEALVADIEAGRYGLIDHFLLIRHGRIVADHRFEQDYESIAALYDTTSHQYNYDHPDWHPYYRDTDLHTMQSVTKSVTSAALGIAMDEGLIPGVQVPALSFFEAYDPDLTDPRPRAMTLEDLLSMRSGIEWNEMISYDDATNSCIIMEASDEWIPYVLDQPMRTDPGTVFDYNSGVSVLLGEIVKVATGQRIDDWARERLSEPIGIRDFYWKVTPSGEIDTEGGLYLTAHDLARIGYLFLHEGMWGEERIISEAWVKASVTPIVADTRPGNNRRDSGYGYQWWVPDHSGRTARVFSGNGYGGQFLRVVPGHDLIEVWNGWNIHGGAELNSGGALWARIMPAIRD